MNVVKKSFQFKILFVFLVLSSCNLQQVIKKAENQKISLSPSYLERFGDSVKFELKVSLPQNSLPKNATYHLVPAFKYGSQVYTFRGQLGFSGDTLSPYDSPAAKGSFSMPYKEGMERGRLVAHGMITHHKTGKQLKTQEEILAEGIITTSELSQIGQYYIDESIPVLGLSVKYGDQEAYGMYKDGWSELQRLFMAYSNLSFSEKSEYMKVIEGRGDFSYKNILFMELKDYDKVRKDILPRFDRLAAVSMAATDKSELEISLLSRQVRKGEVSAGVLNEAEFAEAIDLEPGLREKEILLMRMCETHPSAYSYNNLGVIYLNLANRTLDTTEKNRLLSQALENFDRSNDFFENPYAAYNTGLVYWMMGDKGSAYKAFYRAMAITRVDALRKVHEAALGAVSIYNGDYRLAVIHLNKAEKNEINLFNQGLANLLANDHYNALIQFEESAILDMSNGYPFYGMALIAARNGEEAILYENLAKAVSRSAYLRKRAPVDMEFIRYHDKEGFKDAIR